MRLEYMIQIFIFVQKPELLGCNEHTLKGPFQTATSIHSAVLMLTFSALSSESISSPGWRIFRSFRCNGAWMNLFSLFISYIWEIASVA